MNIEITKDYEGKIVYAIPTGNAARRWDGIPKQFEVVKRKTKYVDLKAVGSHIIVAYHPVNGATQAEINAGYSMNSGYIFFATLGDVEKYKVNQEKRRKVRVYFSSVAYSLSTEQVDLIYPILFPEEVSDE